MGLFFVGMMLVSMFVVLISLGGGMFMMAKMDDKSKAMSQKFMRARVYAQGAAILSLQS